MPDASAADQLDREYRTTVLHSRPALRRDVEALLHVEGLAPRAFVGHQLVTEPFVEPSGVENRSDIDLRRGCSVPEVGLGTSDQAGPETSPLRVRGHIDVSKVLASPTGASNDESIGLGDEELPILDNAAWRKASTTSISPASATLISIRISPTRSKARHRARLPDPRAVHQRDREYRTTGCRMTAVRCARHGG